MKKLSKAIILVLTAVVIIPACKKGANDPFISFHSRKARVAGEWSVINYDMAVNSTITPSSGGITTFTGSDTHDGKTWTGNSTRTTNSVEKHNYTGPVTTHSYSFLKDGTWSSKLDYTTTETDASQPGQTTKTTIHTVSSYSGSWDFLNGVPADYKKKEAISVSTIKEDLSVTTTTEVTLTGASTSFKQTDVDNSSNTYAQNENVMVWKLTELKNKEIIAELKQENSTGGSTVTGSNAPATKTTRKNTVTGKITLKQ